MSGLRAPARRLAPAWLRRSLRARLVGYFLVLAVATVLVVGLLVNARATEELQRAISDRLAAAAALKVDAVEGWLEEQRRSILFVAGILDGRAAGGDDAVHALLVAGDPGEAQVAADEIGGRLANVVDQSDDTALLMVLDRDGVIRASSVAEHVGVSQGDEDYFRRGTSGARIEGFFTSSLTGEPTIAVATPLFDGGSNRVGTLAAFLDFVRLDRIVAERTGLGGTGETFLVTSEGRLASRAIGAQPGDRVTSPGVTAALEGLPGQALYETSNGTAVIGAWRWITEIDSALMAEITQQEALAPARELAGTIALVGLGATALLAIGIALISRAITRPIHGLARTAGEIAGGNLDAVAPVTSEDEVGSLARTFNAMTAQLRENLATLERRVEERTAELQQRNSELAIVNEVGQALAAKLEFAKIIETVGERVANALHAQGLSIAIRDESTDQISFIYWIDQGVRRRELEGSVLDDEVSRRIVESGAPIRFVSADDASERGMPYKVPGTESYVGVPIPVGDRTIGVMALGTTERDAYSEDDERLLVTVASNMGVAIDNARLFAELSSALAAKGEAEVRYRRLVEEMPIALYIDRPDERAASEYVSPMIVPMFGYPAEAWESDEFFPTILHPEDRDRVIQNHFDVFERGDDRWSWDFRIIAADGRTVWVHDEAVVVKDEEGKALYVQGFMQDVTEEREAAAEVRRQKQYFEALVEASPVAIVVMSREEIVTAWNPAAERLFGYSVDEAVSRHIDDLIFSAENRSQGAITTIEAREQGRAHRIGQRMRKDGRMVEVEIVVVPLVLDGEHAGYYAIYHDITDLVEAHKAAEAANEAKSAFLAAMSHEIRTPMNAIIGMSGLLTETQLADDQREYAETIRNSSEALLTIINDILDFSKIEAGRVELEAEPFEPQRTIEGALDVLAPAAAAKGIELAYEPSPDLPTGLIGDAGRLRQILLNLLSNAVKFTEAGEVVLSVGAAPIDGGRWEVTIEVRDTGIGIPPDRMDRLFQSFSQVDASVSRRYGGTGLGLAISRRLAELMDGSLTAESSGVAGEGSTFRLCIRVEAASEPIARPSPQPGAVSGRRALIVDDNATNRRILELQAERWGMDVHSTERPEEAIGWVRDGAAFDVALLDFHMPEMDGQQLAAKLRELRSDTPIPVVILSSVGTHDRSDPSVTATLTKPIKPSALYDVLAEIFGTAIEHAAPTPSASDPDERMGEQHPLRILLVEDNAMNRRLATILLERMGYGADVATNGLEAIEAVERTTYDVVLMDLQMPELDGLEATRRIRSRFTDGARPRIVALTANAMAEDRQATVEAGMDDYLSKPIRPAELSAALRRTERRTDA